MDEKPFKFRYANQIAGTFVLLALGLAIAGVIAAGRSKGWFEGKFELHATFPIGEGTFGLNEGNEVLVRNTVAGRVKNVQPDEAGQMVATFEVRRSFQQFVTQDSVARVKKKFGVAGDTFLEIETGTGTPLQDGDAIETKKDEAVMDTAQQVLEEVRQVIVPMMDEIKDILHHLNLITGGIQDGRGIAGAVLKDDEIVREVKVSLAKVQDILDETRVIAGEARALVSDPELKEDIRGSIGGARALIEDSQAAVRETTRVLRGVQKHWLLRKYIPEEKEDLLLAAPYAGGAEQGALERELSHRLEQARVADDSAAIALTAARLAALLLGRGHADEAGNLVREARAEAESAARGIVGAAIAEAFWLRAEGRSGDAIRTLSAVLPRADDRDRELWILGHLLMADLFVQDDKPDDARAMHEAASRRMDGQSPAVLLAMEAHVWARLQMQEGLADEAAAGYDREAGHLRQAAAYPRMATALAHAAAAYAQAGAAVPAADRYFRAARSRMAAGDASAARGWIEKAREQAQKGGDSELLSRIGRLEAELGPAPENAS